MTGEIESTTKDNKPKKGKKKKRKHDKKMMYALSGI